MRIASHTVLKNEVSPDHQLLFSSSLYWLEPENDTILPFVQSTLHATHVNIGLKLQYSGGLN